jgi:hypothetical protein
MRPWRSGTEKQDPALASAILSIALNPFTFKAIEPPGR